MADSQVDFGDIAAPLPQNLPPSVRVIKPGDADFNPRVNAGQPYTYPMVVPVTPRAAPKAPPQAAEPLPGTPGAKPLTDVPSQVDFSDVPMAKKPPGKPSPTPAPAPAPTPAPAAPPPSTAAPTPAPTPPPPTAAPTVPGPTAAPVVPATPSGILGTPEHPSKTESVLSGIASGLTLNWGDQLHGAIAAGGGKDGAAGSPLSGIAHLIWEHTFGDPNDPDSATARYNKAVAEARKNREAAQAENPISYGAGALAGAVGGSLLLPGLAPLDMPAAATTLGVAPRTFLQGAGNLGTRMATGAVNAAVPGAVYGGIAGAGGSPDNRLGGAVHGALFGTTLGMGLGAGGTLAGTAIRSVFPRATDAADRIMTGAFNRDYADVDDVIRLMRERALEGQPMTAADLAGTNVQSQAGNVLRLQSAAQQRARQFVEQRQTGTDLDPLQAARTQGAPPSLMGTAPITSQAQRVDEALQGLTGTQQGGTLANQESIIASRRAAANVNYPAADRTPINYNSRDGQWLLDNLDRVPQSARASANHLMQTEGSAGHQLVYQMNPATGGYELAAVPNLRHWRYIRRGLDTAIRGDRDARGQLGPHGHAYQELRDQIDARLKAMSPALRHADAHYESDSRMLEALEQGGRAHTRTREQVRREMARLNLGEREMYRLGYINKLRELNSQGRDGADHVMKIIGAPGAREKMGDIIGQGPQLDRFMRHVQAERSMSATRQQHLGSATAERVASQSDLATASMIARMGAFAKRYGTAATVGMLAGHQFGHASIGAIMGLIAAGRWTTAAHAIAHALAKIDPAKRAGVLEHIARIAIDPNPANLQAFADRVRGLTPPQRRTVVGTVMNTLASRHPVTRAAIEQKTRPARVKRRDE